MKAFEEEREIEQYITLLLWKNDLSRNVIQERDKKKEKVIT